MDFKLRKWCENDLKGVVKHANNYNIAKFLVNKFPHPFAYDDAKIFFASIMDDNPIKIFAIEINGEASGAIGIFPLTDIHSKNAEIAYWLSRDYWGNGIMTNAIKQIVDYGFQTFDINRIFARPFSTNKSSQRVLEKSGFVLEARFEKTLFKNGEFIDELIYGKRRIQ